MKAGKDYIGTGLGAIILNENGEVLLMKRGEKCKNEIGKWAVIGGKLDFGETLEQGIIREVFEETNIKIKIDGQIPYYDHLLPEENQHWIAHVFIAHIVKGIPKNMEPEKCSELKWFSFKKLPSPIAKMSQPALKYFKIKFGENI